MSAAELVRSSAKPLLGVQGLYFHNGPVTYVGCLQGQKECIEDEPNLQLGELVALLLSILEVGFRGVNCTDCHFSTQIQQSTRARQFRLPLNHKLSAGQKQLALSCDCQALLLSLCFA